MFRRGVFPGAVTGGVIGLAPGILLILVLTGDSYHIGGAEVLGFIIMCVAAGRGLRWHLRRSGRQRTPVAAAFMTRPLPFSGKN